MRIATDTPNTGGILLNSLPNDRLCNYLMIYDIILYSIYLIYILPNMFLFMKSMSDGLMNIWSATQFRRPVCVVFYNLLVRVFGSR